MKGRSGAVYYHSRYIIIVVLLSLAVVGLIVRIVKLTIIDQPFLTEQGNSRSIRIIETPAYRGTISDRNGAPLAISTPVVSAWVNPQVFDQNHPELFQLSELLDMPVNMIKDSVEEAFNREFVYLKRGIKPITGQAIETLQIPGVYLRQELRRFYPEGEVTTHVLGFTNIDDQGQEGVELAYNDWLKGTPGRKRIIKDRFGYVIAELDEIQQSRPGNDLRLSIDRRIQYIAYRELKQAVQEHKAHSGSVVILDPKTGEILAMVNYPAYNPNKRFKKHNEYYRNRAVTDIFEPGSVAKVFSIAAALTSGQYRPDTMIDTNPSWIVVAGHTIQDLQANGQLTVAEVLQRSSNVGVAKIVLSLPPEITATTLRNFGIGEITGVGFPGESAGILSYQAFRRPFDLATLGFGYGMAVTTLQLAQAYAVFANNGQLQPASLLVTQNKTPARQVLEPEIAKQMLVILESVVSNGTGSRAKTDSYQVAGKTGTSRIVGPQGYVKDRHVATFVGIAPVNSPRIVVSVVLNEPENDSYYGGIIAAPVFSRIVTETFKILQVPPDDVR